MHTYLCLLKDNCAETIVNPLSHLSKYLWVNISLNIFIVWVHIQKWLKTAFFSTWEITEVQLCNFCHSGKFGLWWGLINYSEGSCTITGICNIVLELLAWNFCKPPAIGCHETRDGQLLKVSLLEKVFLVFSFPCCLSPITVFYGYYVLPTHSKHAFFPPLCVYLSVLLPFMFLLTTRLCAALKK